MTFRSLLLAATLAAALVACAKTDATTSTSLPLTAAELQVDHRVLVRLEVTESADAVSLKATGIDMEATVTDVTTDEAALGSDAAATDVVEADTGASPDVIDDDDDGEGHHGHGKGHGPHGGGHHGDGAFHDGKGHGHGGSMLVARVAAFPTDGSALSLLGLDVTVPKDVQDLASALEGGPYRFRGHWNADAALFESRHLSTTASATPRILAAIEAVTTNADGSLTLTLLGQPVQVPADLAVTEVASLKDLIDADLDGYDASAPERQ